MNELSLEDQERISADLENRFQMWKERQVIGQLSDMGIQFIPDSSHLAHERDYGHRKPKASPLPIATIIGAVMWAPFLFYCFRKPILKFFGVE